MNALFALLQALCRSALRTGKRDSRTKIGLIVGLAFDLGVAAWSIQQLRSSLAQWQAAGPGTLELRLWMLYLGTWLGIALFTVLGVLQHAFADDMARFLLTLPLAPATRARGLYLQVMFGLGNWILLAAGIFGLSLVSTIGIGAWPWLALLLTGILLVVWLMMVGVLLALRYLSPWNGLLVLLVALAALVLHSWIPLPSTLPSAGWSSSIGATLVLSGLSVLAGPTGRLYTSAFLRIQAYGDKRATVRVWGLAAIGRSLARQRTLTGALLWKGLWSQSRNPLLWARLAALVIYVAIFPAIRSALANYDLPNVLVVTAYASGLAILLLLDSAPSPFGGEGNRLTLYLVAPLDTAEILRAQFFSLLPVLLLPGLLVVLALGQIVGLALLDLAYATLAASFIITAAAGLITWGSAWDINLDAAVEGTMQAFLQDELLITPRRVALLNLTLLQVAASLLLFWKLAPLPALLMLALLDLVVLFLAWKLASMQIRQLPL